MILKNHLGAIAWSARGAQLLVLGAMLAPEQATRAQDSKTLPHEEQNVRVYVSEPGEPKQQATTTTNREVRTVVIGADGARRDIRTFTVNKDGRVVSETTEERGAPPGTSHRSDHVSQATSSTAHDEIELAESLVQIQQAKLNKTEIIQKARSVALNRLNLLRQQNALPVEAIEKASAELEEAQADVEIARAELKHLMLKLAQLQRSLLATQRLPGKPGENSQSRQSVQFQIKPDQPGQIQDQSVRIQIDRAPEPARSNFERPLQPPPPLPPSDPVQPPRSGDSFTRATPNASRLPESRQVPELKPEHLPVPAPPTPVVPPVRSSNVGDPFAPPVEPPAEDRRAETITRLKQIGLALHNHADQHDGRFPPAALENAKTGEKLLSWRVLILPYLGAEAAALYNEFKLDEPWDSDHNSRLLERMPEVYKTTSDQPAFTRFKVFVEGPFEGQPTSSTTLWVRPPGTRISEILDGTSNTIAVVEGLVPVPWTKPDMVPLIHPSEERDNLFSQPFLACMADGLVRTVQGKPELLKFLFTRAGGEVIDLTQFTPANALPVTTTTDANPFQAFRENLLRQKQKADAERAQAQVSERQALEVQFRKQQADLEQLQEENRRTRARLDEVLKSQSQPPR